MTALTRTQVTCAEMQRRNASDPTFQNRILYHRRLPALLRASPECARGFFGVWPLLISPASAHHTPRLTLPQWPHWAFSVPSTHFSPDLPQSFRVVWKALGLSLESTNSYSFLRFSLWLFILSRGYFFPSPFSESGRERGRDTERKEH